MADKTLTQKPMQVTNTEMLTGCRERQTEFAEG